MDTQLDITRTPEILKPGVPVIIDCDHPLYFSIREAIMCGTLSEHAQKKHQGEATEALEITREMVEDSNPLQITRFPPNGAFNEPILRITPFSMIDLSVNSEGKYQTPTDILFALILDYATARDLYDLETRQWFHAEANHPYYAKIAHIFVEILQKEELGKNTCIDLMMKLNISPAFLISIIASSTPNELEGFALGMGLLDLYEKEIIFAPLKKDPVRRAQFSLPTSIQWKPFLYLPGSIISGEQPAKTGRSENIIVTSFIRQFINDMSLLEQSSTEIVNILVGQIRALNSLRKTTPVPLHGTNPFIQKIPGYNPHKRRFGHRERNGRSDDLGIKYFPA